MKLENYMRSIMNIYTIVPATLIWVILLIAGAAAQTSSDHNCHSKRDDIISMNNVPMVHSLSSITFGNVPAISVNYSEMPYSKDWKFKKRHCPITVSQNHCHMCFEKVILLHSALLRERKNDGNEDHLARIWCASRIQHLCARYCCGPPGWWIIFSLRQRPLNLFNRFRI